MGGGDINNCEGVSGVTKMRNYPPRRGCSLESTSGGRG